MSGWQNQTNFSRRVTSEFLIFYIVCPSSCSDVPIPPTIDCQWTNLSDRFIHGITMNDCVKFCFRLLWCWLGKFCVFVLVIESFSTLSHHFFLFSFSVQLNSPRTLDVSSSFNFGTFWPVDCGCQCMRALL